MARVVAITSTASPSTSPARIDGLALGPRIPTRSPFGPLAGLPQGDGCRRAAQRDRVAIHHVRVLRQREAAGSAAFSTASQTTGRARSAAVPGMKPPFIWICLRRQTLVMTLFPSFFRRSSFACRFRCTSFPSICGYASAVLPVLRARGAVSRPQRLVSRPRWTSNLQPARLQNCLLRPTFHATGT